MTTTCDPISAIRKLPTIETRLDEIRGRLSLEIVGIQTVWEGLGRAGGQREDHAAEFLKRLIPHFEKLQSFSADCLKYIEMMIADPFGGEEQTCDTKSM